MSFKYKNNLKVEFRAVPYSTSHILEYRISPNQDLNYEKEYSFFGFRFTIKRKFKTNWHQPFYFNNHITAYLYSKNDSFNYLPLFIDSKYELETFREKFKTIGQFISYFDEKEKRELHNWSIERNNYLNNCGVWE